MPIIETGILVTMALQTFTTLANQRLNSKNIAKIKEMQQKEREKNQQHSIERDYKKFKRSCQLQMQIEEESHNERLSDISQELLKTFDKMAHQANLYSHYPLNISPYIIGHSVIPTSGAQLECARQEIFCLLTNSNDRIFNKEIIPYVDMALGNLISSYWNQSSMHTMCYFTNTWNENKAFCDEDIENLKSTIITPTLTLTPYFEKSDKGYTIVVKINMWGIGSELSCQAKSNITFAKIPTKYSTEEIDNIVLNLVPSILCIAALNIDTYYWSCYHLPPILPRLIKEGLIAINKKEKDAYTDSYIQLYESLVLGSNCSLVNKESDKALIKDIAMINQCNLPDQNVEFLSNVVNFIEASPKSNQLIKQTLVNLYESHTGEKCTSIKNMDARLLNFDDMNIVSKLNKIANTNGNFDMARQLTDLIVRKICSYAPNLNIMEENIIKQKIEIARKKLLLLKEQCTNTQMGIRTLLELASQIRDSIINDEDVTAYCNSNTEYALCRQSFLNEIRDVQLSLIMEHTNPQKNLGSIGGNVKDFSQAKQDLITIIENEQAIHLFVEDEKPQIFKAIRECQTHEQTLQNAINNCKNGKYKVLIMGDFQTGKSTTVDAMCDGRHVCALGNGNATSAVPVTITYADKERTEIHWRTKKQLTGILVKIRQYLPDYDFEHFDLDLQQERKNLANAINVLRTSKDCPNMSEKDAKFLMISDFILCYYGSVELVQKKTSKEYIAETAEITKFPDHGETIWKKQGLEKFTIDEALFVFIEKVDCFIPSETLQKLNCTIIDSPGLFNGSYDTMITEQAMVEAHAIMLILPYQKAIGQDMNDTLRNIKKNYPDVLRKLFIANNLRPGLDEVFESNCEKVKEMFGAEKEVYPYDAKLTYLLQVKGLYDKGEASKKDVLHLLKDKIRRIGKSIEKTYDSFDEAWASHISKYADVLEDSYTRTIQGHIEDGLQKSGFADLIAALQSFVEGNESYAMIVSNGIAPMINEVSAIKSSLYRSYVEPYFSSQKEIEERWKNRIKIAEEFQNYLSEMANNVLFNNNKPGSLLSRMAEEEYCKLFTPDFYSELSKAIAEVLYENKSKLVVTKSVFKTKKFKDRFIEISSPLIQKKLIELLNRKIYYLYEMLDCEQDSIVKNMFTPVMVNLEYELEKKWNSMYKDDTDIHMREYITIPKSLKSQQANEVHNKTYNVNSVVDTEGASTLFSGLVTEISAIVAGIAAIIAGYVTVIVCDASGSSLIIFALLGIGGTIWESLAPGSIREQFISKLSKKLLPQIYSKKIETCFRETVKEHMKKFFEHYSSSLFVDIQKMKNERDLALRPTSDKENLCFRSVEAIEMLNQQLNAYNKFMLEHLTYETT